MDEQAAESELRFAEEAAPGLTGLDATRVFEQLERRYGPLAAALEWFVTELRTDEALRLATSLARFWTASKRLDDGSAWLDRVLALPGGDGARRGRALFDAGMLSFWQGADDRATTLHDRALELGRRQGDATVAALALGGLARVALRAGEIEEARRLCREALAVTHGTDDRAGRSGALHVLGVAAQMAGDLLEARELMTERLELMRELENHAGISSEAGNLSMVERQLGDLDRAEALAREALAIDDRRGDMLPVPWKLNSLGAVAAARGDLERAATLIGAADALLEAQGAAWPPDELRQYEATVAELTNAMGSDVFSRVRAAGRALSARNAVDFALATSAR